MLLEPRFFGANASDDNRLAYQAFWFPGGVIFDRRQEVRTRLKPVAAEVYPLTATDGKKLASLRGFEPLLSA